MYDELIKVVRERRSCKNFRSDPVANDLVTKVVDAGIWAASGRGLQSPIVIRIKDAALRARISAENAAILGREIDPFYGAPEILLVLVESSVNTAVCDGSLVLGNMMLAAHALGLGSCWIHRAREESENPNGVVAEIVKRLSLPGKYVGVGHLALGYAAAPLPPPPPRKPGRSLEV